MNNNIESEEQHSRHADIAIRIVERLVEEGILKSCIDTNSEDEFLTHDIIVEELKYDLEQE